MRIGDAIEKLRDAYPRESFSASTARVFAEDLSDLDDREVYDAVTRLVRTNVRRPSIAEIRLEVAEAISGLPDPERAWDLAMAGTSAGIPELAAAIQACGGVWSIQHSENPTTLRAQFVKDYVARRDRALRQIAGGAVVTAKALDPPTGIHSKAVAEIPVSTRIRPRPIMLLRLNHHFAGRIVPRLIAFGDDDRAALMHDAIEILAEGPTVEDDPLWIEAHRVLDEATELAPG